MIEVDVGRGERHCHVLPRIKDGVHAGPPVAIAHGHPEFRSTCRKAPIPSTVFAVHPLSEPIKVGRLDPGLKGHLRHCDRVYIQVRGYVVVRPVQLECITENTALTDLADRCGQCDRIVARIAKHDAIDGCFSFVDSHRVSVHCHSRCHIVHDQSETNLGPVIITVRGPNHNLLRLIRTIIRIV